MYSKLPEGTTVVEVPYEQTSFEFMEERAA
jgi:hypothetical protein